MNAFKQYLPIDYGVWDFSGRGRNLQDRFSDKECILWQLALPLQDKRGDSGHAECVTYFAWRYLLLCGREKSTPRQIVMPAAMLHDIGWSELSDDARHDIDNPDNRVKHQLDGVRLAAPLLLAANWDRAHIGSILEIISQHDTRKGFYSWEDKVMRDADKLARFTYMNVQAHMVGREGMSTLDQVNTWALNHMNKGGLFGFESSRYVAESEWANTMKYLRTQGWK